MLRRSGPIKSRQRREWEAQRASRAEREPRPMAGLERVPDYGGGVIGQPVPKENAVEHEGYRRLVAGFPCARCFVWGYSQAAHPPPTGKGIKEDDRECFPLCCTREGQIGCHYLFDNYKLMPHDAAVEQAKQWGRETRAKVINRGLWPKGLAMWSETA